MNHRWPKRIGGAVAMALTWAAVWAAAGVLLGTIVDPDDSMDEPWWAMGAYPAVLCAAIFAIALGVSARQRRIDELPLSKVGAFGAASGLLVGTLPFLLGTPSRALPLWLWVVVVVGSLTLLSSVSAVASAMLARLARKRSSLDAGANPA